MKHILFVLLTLCCIEVADAQTFGYSYGSGRCDVQGQTPIAEPGAGRPEAVWAVSGNLQPFGTCANNHDTPPPMALRVPAGANRLPLADKTLITQNCINRLEMWMYGVDWLC